MARATRSTTVPVQDDPSGTSRKSNAKKRKRNSNVEAADSPPSKQTRTDDKDEEVPPQPSEVLSSGDVPIRHEDAEHISEILEMVNNQGLLDQPIPAVQDSADTNPDAAPDPPTAMHSLRSLLKDHLQCTPNVFRSAVDRLIPPSSLSRAPPSDPSVQKLRFRNLAMSLLDEASRDAAPAPLESPSIFPSVDTAEAPASEPSSSVLRPSKYALVQHLPTGDWWSSTSSKLPSDVTTNLSSLPTGHADMVAIFPTPLASTSQSEKTLADFVTRRRIPGAVAAKPLAPRRVYCGKFLDYGPYASFAPSFDQDGVEIGRYALGEVIIQQELRRRIRRLAKGKARAIAEEPEADEAVIDPSLTGTDAHGLESLLSEGEVSQIKSALGTLELERSVDELLKRNAKAMERLGELQSRRLEDGTGASVEVGSEEWDIAQGILDSLTLLASLRPRPSGGDAENAPLIPPASVLHKLRRTLPLEATPSWQGTLPAGRTSAYHDNTTLHVRSSATTTQAKPVPASSVVPTTPAPATATPAYTPYNYSATPYRGGYGTYTPTQNTGYYAGYNPSAQAYHPTQYAATGQQQYPTAYAGWYNYQTAPATTAASTPGQATSTTPASSVAPSYASFFASATQQPQPQRAVANTVLGAASKPYQPSAWNGAAAQGQTAPTLPAHMRGVAAAASAPGTPTPPPVTPTAGGSYPPLAYYGAYPTQAR